MSAAVIPLRPARTKLEELAYAYRVGFERRKRELRALIETEMYCARIALESMRAVTDREAWVEALDLALIARHHHEQARKLRAELAGYIEL